MFVRLVLSAVALPRVQTGSVREQIVLITVEPVPAGGRPPAAVSVGISTGERRSFGASAPLSTRAASLRESVRGLAFMPKLVDLVGPAPTLFAEQLSPPFARSAAVPYERLRNLMSGLSLPP